ncbi:hypothetical protein WJX73_000627 [Symbiochloris irregularis]|uniref:1,4-alpha-glucan branching enzyme n=1 Tax=Symbiochloris irregularis TaxID=706552 RepID=A0AAW1PHQ2_9CHLO
MFAVDKVQLIRYCNLPKGGVSVKGKSRSSRVWRRPILCIASLTPGHFAWPQPASGLLLPVSTLPADRVCLLTKLPGQSNHCHRKASRRAYRVQATLGILSTDPMLEDHSDHLRKRHEQYQRTKAAIEDAEGSLQDFAKGYTKLGFNRVDGATVYAEWAPAADRVQLIGDFNSWGGTELNRGPYGVWSATIPDGPHGEPGIPHGSRARVRLHHQGGVVDRVPAWATWCWKDPHSMSAHYDAILWQPPQHEQYQWQHGRPGRPESLLIYEAHVGMSSEEQSVASYPYFKDNVLPRIARLGYTAVQLMAVQEHAFFASFGYHVTSAFAVSSRSGNPEELKALIDEAHRLGLVVLLDVVHSHMSSNAEDGLAGFDLGQAGPSNYFCQGEAGYHKQWDSRLFNYGNWETLRFLLSNLRWWLEEYRFDGFRFDGVTSMLYHHHGIDRTFSGNYHEYFGDSINMDAVVYLMLANDLVHSLRPEAITIAEDVSGMPALCQPVQQGGTGFNYRLAMGLPDVWTRLLKDVRDEHWSTQELVSLLCNRRYDEGTVAYAECHDQSLVGDQGLAWRLMGSAMYTGMSTFQPPTPPIDRGMALHKMIRLLTISLGGDAWLNFMGNEFGHPEWVDFPREGNGWSHQYCRRQWSLVDKSDLRYRELNDWDAAMLKLEADFKFLSSKHQLVSHAGSDDKPPKQVIVAERGPLLFVFNFSPFDSFEGFKVGVPEGGRYQVVLDSDAAEFGGKGRVGHDVEHFSSPEGIPGQPETNFNDRPHSILILAPSRTAVVYRLLPEKG